MYKRRHNTVVDFLGRMHMNTDPFWFYNLVVFFDEDNDNKPPNGMLSFYDLFVDQLDVKLFEEQIPQSLNNSRACFYYLN
ncbi:hypothetical protein [Tenuifilum thalassicum]|uniref:Uncharacterized protein n=1 Tax=Tenuifilum thalassicum TaxID=2590900 RepID=A0A7D4CFS9_9BACT|nr:hypothetical protein [Tenuifilum thalassicum]QKG79266.1 hypothetical protein FHG85_02965 [Tenuifilum thalassicum]